MTFGVAELCRRLEKHGGALSEPFGKTHEKKIYLLPTLAYHLLDQKETLVKEQ